MPGLLRREKTRNLILSAIGVLIAVVYLFPLYWIFSSSLKTDPEIFRIPTTLYPHEITLEPYIGQLTGSDSLLSSARNSFLIAVSAMTISFCLAVPAAYGISRFKLPGGKAIIMTFLVTQMLPASMILTPLFLNYSRMGLLNTYIAPVLAVATITIPFTLLVLRPMFMACPAEIEEAARIDGCNRFMAFLRVMLPILKPGLVTVCCFGFVHGWNDLTFSLTFNSSGALYPMTASVYRLMNEYGIRWNWIMAYGCMLVTPPVLIFVLAQKYIISGVVGGAVKG